MKKTILIIAALQALSAQAQTTPEAFLDSIVGLHSLRGNYEGCRDIEIIKMRTATPAFYLRATGTSNLYFNDIFKGLERGKVTGNTFKNIREYTSDEMDSWFPSKIKSVIEIKKGWAGEIESLYVRIDQKKGLSPVFKKYKEIKCAL